MIAVMITAQRVTYVLCLFVVCLGWSSWLVGWIGGGGGGIGNPRNPKKKQLICSTVESPSNRYFCYFFRIVCDIVNTAPPIVVIFQAGAAHTFTSNQLTLNGSLREFLISIFRSFACVRACVIVALVRTPVVVVGVFFMTVYDANADDAT